MTLPSPSPAPGPTQTSAPSGWRPSAPAPATHPPTGLVRDAIAEVAVEDLRVRSLPEISDASRKYLPFLQPGDTVFVVDGPVAADGYDWYLVQSLIGGVREGPFGWVSAAGRDGEAWITDPATVACPDLSTGTPLLEHAPPEVLLHCFGDQPIAFALETDPFCEGGPSGEPRWLMVLVCQLPSDARDLVISGGPDDTPAIPTMDRGVWAMRGHFDDPAAMDCVRLASPPRDPAETVHRCRTTFVLDALDPIDDPGEAIPVVLPYCGRPIRPSTLALIDATSAACYGSRDLAFDATLVARAIDIDGPVPDTPDRFVPVRLPDLGDPLFLVDRGAEFDFLRSIQLRVADPALVPTALPAPVDVRVVGHVNDPASRKCRASADEPESSGDDRAVEICRSTFIVTSMTPAE